MVELTIIIELTLLSGLLKMEQRDVHAMILTVFHYDNRPIYAIFHCCKNANFQLKNCQIFSYFCSNYRLQFLRVPTIYVLVRRF